MGIFMSIPHMDSVGKVQKILLFETVFHDSASDCTTLTLGFPTGHNLHSLLKTCKDTLRRVEKEQSGLRLSELRLDVIEACVTTFYSGDISAFRYPINAEGTRLLEDTYFIDVLSLSEAIGRIDTFYFDEAIMAFSDFLDQKPLK